MILFLFCMTVGFGCAAQESDGLTGWQITSAYLAFMFCSFFGSTMNFYSDVEADRIHNDLYKDQPMSTQPFATGEMGKVETLLVFIVSALASIGFSLLAGWWFAFFNAAALLVLGFIYSSPWIHFKARAGWDVVTNSIGMTILVVAGWKLAAPADSWPPALFLIYVFVFVFMFYLPTVANDIPFDEAAGYRNSGVVFGAKRLLNAMIPLCVILTGVGVLLLTGSYGWPLKLFIALATPCAWLFTWAVHKLYVPPHIRFDTSLLIYPVSAVAVFYFVIAVNEVLNL